MTKIDKMEQMLATIKDQLDDLYEGQQTIKDMIRELTVDAAMSYKDDGFSTIEDLDEDLE